MVGCRLGGREKVGLQGIGGVEWSRIGGGLMLKFILWIFLRSPENIGGVAGCRWGERVKDG